MDKIDLVISIKAARVNAELTLKEASKAIGVATSTLCDYESGKSSPRGDTLQRMSNLYKWPIDHFRL